MPFSDVLRRRLRDPVLVCALVAVAVRGVASWQGFANNVVVHSPQLDGMYYVKWAIEIAQGDLAGREGIVGGAPYFLNPLYAFFLAPIALAFKGGFIPWVLVLQALLGGATTALSAASARRLFGAVGAWSAGIAVAFSSALVHLDGHISISGMGAFLMAGAIWSCVPPRDGRTGGILGGPQGPIAAGLWLGFGALARPITPLALPLFAWLQARRAPAGRRAQAVAVVLLVFLAPATLSFVRNWKVGGEAVVYTAASGANLWLGNCRPARENGMMSPAGRFRFNPIEMHADARHYLEPRLGPDATWSDISDAFRDDTLNELAAHPVDFVGYLFTKARWFFSPREVPSSASLEIDVEVAPLLRIAFVPTWLIAVVGFIGLALHVRRLEVLLGPGAVALAHLGVLTLVFPLSHYRSPAIPALAVLAGGAIAWGVTAWAGRRRRALAAALAGATALGAVAWLPPQPSTIRHAGLLTSAICHRDLGHYDLAEDFARRAVASFAEEFEGRETIAGPWFVLGYVYFERDHDLAQSAEHYRRGLESEPFDWNARLTVVECLMHLVRLDEALSELDTLVELDPDQYFNPAVRARYAEVLTKMGRLDEAREHAEWSLRHGRTPSERPRRWAVPPDLRQLRPPPRRPK